MSVMWDSLLTVKKISIIHTDESRSLQEVQQKCIRNVSFVDAERT